MNDKSRETPNLKPISRYTKLDDCGWLLIT